MEGRAYMRCVSYHSASEDSSYFLFVGSPQLGQAGLDVDDYCQSSVA